MATTITNYVDPNSTPGGSGTTPEKTGANRAFNSISEWCDSVGNKNLVSQDLVYDVVFRNDGANYTDPSTGDFYLGTWTCDSSFSLF